MTHAGPAEAIYVFSNIYNFMMGATANRSYRRTYGFQSSASCKILKSYLT